MRKLVILGSTGSIGTQTLELVDFLYPEWEIIALSANDNIKLLEKQIRKYNPLFAVVMNLSLVNELKYRIRDLKTEVLDGMEGLEYIAAYDGADLIINSLVGAVGLKPSIAAIKAGNRLGLANKESLVIGGSIINEYIRDNRDMLLPIDSEHNAIFNILSGHKHDEIETIILTASGGPFLNYPVNKLKYVSVKEALNHPNWNMGGKISIDSATLMNKGLEVIEAHWLFKQSYDKIRVVVHPESIIHSMVEFTNKFIMAELGVSDMRMPIQNILEYPEIKKGIAESLDFFKLGKLTFMAPDTGKFPALRLAFEAGKAGGSLPVVLNAANEIAVASFMKEMIPFTKIPVVIEKVLNKHNKIENLSLNNIYQIDEWSRKITEEVIKDVNYNN
jgi:1-deoxy-D-xylulose-5-phosphate reductoisomerase